MNQFTLNKLLIKVSVVLLLSIAVLFTACRQNADKNHRYDRYNFKTGRANTTLSGKILNSAEMPVFLSCYGFSDTVYTDKNGAFKFELSLESGKYFNFKDGKSSFKIFLAPKYNLEITYAADSSKEQITFKGMGAEENTYLADKNRAMRNTGTSASQIFELRESQFQNYIDSMYTVEAQLLELFTTHKLKPNNQFIKFEQAAITYKHATLLIEYLSSSSQAYTIDPNVYLRFIDGLTLNDADLLEVYEYRLFLNAFINFKVFDKTQEQNLSPADISLKKLQEVSAQITDQNVKDYLLYTYLKEHIKYYGYGNTLLLFQTFEYQCRDDFYKQELLTPYEHYKLLQQKQKAPAISMFNKDGNSITLDNFIGRYIYIDVWATWCVPCRKEAPFFDELRQNYKHKNIEFISISIDSKHEDWMNYLATKADDNQQYWMADGAPFLEAYMIKTIPHFLIIDDKGNLIDNNASRPSDKKVQWIEQLPDRIVP